MAADTVNVPIHIIPEILRRNLARDFMELLKMKATEGRWLEGVYPAAMLFRFERRGWLKFHEGKHYQASMEQMFPCKGMFTHAKISVGCLDDVKQFKAMLFIMGNSYLMSPQAQRGLRSRRKRQRPHVNESRHMGGVSLTLCMSFFGLSKTWCHKMRKTCEALGLARWRRRWVKVRKDAHGAFPGTAADAMCEGPGKFKFDKDGELREEVAARFEQIAETWIHIPYEYRRETYQRYL